MAAVGKPPNTPLRSRILDVPVDCVNMDQTLDRLREFVASGRPHLVVTLDASGAAQAQEDDELKALYERADLLTPDSTGIIWAVNRKGKCLSERVSGVEIVDRVCAMSADHGYRIYFLGGAPGVADEAAERLRLKHPGCHIVGVRHGYFPSESDAVVADEIGMLNPDFLFVGMGIPRQEKFILSTMERHRARVAMGVGGSFDVFSGRVKRAPKLFQQMKIEWFWRLMQNPKKIGKVMMLPKFLMLVLKQERQ
jgi:N-acetylglucosaminyldiphosphoundecaprenol N-acetyl-beta-D-mannosaminyltransferase